MNNLSICNSEHFASGADDGSVRVWSLDSREQTLQFQVLDQVIIKEIRIGEMFMKLCNRTPQLAYFQNG